MYLIKTPPHEEQSHYVFKSPIWQVEGDRFIYLMALLLILQLPESLLCNQKISKNCFNYTSGGQWEAWCAPSDPACRAVAEVRSSKQEAKHSVILLAYILGRRSPWVAVALYTWESALPWQPLKASGHLFPNKNVGGRGAVSWRQAGSVGPPGSDSQEKHLMLILYSTCIAVSSPWFLPPPAALHFFGCWLGWCLCWTAVAGFGWLGAGGRHSWLHIALTSQESPVSTLLASSFLPLIGLPRIQIRSSFLYAGIPRREGDLPGEGPVAKTKSNHTTQNMRGMKWYGLFLPLLTGVHQNCSQLKALMSGCSLLGR